uniref:Uncharacterized protein n=1 Tax=Ditylenchus dipsaci TaxID=166011 RepID=A0A915CR47_9BILA
MVFSTRISIQWPPAPAQEPTKTYVMTSPKDQHFVDLRPYLSNTLPVAKTSFPFEWSMSGTEEELENGNIMFHH